MLFEQKYWIKRKTIDIARTVLYRLMPRWLVREVFMYAGRYIKDDEVVPDVLFMDVFHRICANELPLRERGTRVTS
jgi:hypothetical protein